MKNYYATFAALFLIALGICALGDSVLSKFLGASQAVTHIPLETLFGNPEKLSPKIAPDATKIAYIAPYNNVLNLWVAPLDAVDKAQNLTSDTNQGITSYGWARDGKSILYAQDSDGDENYHIYQVNLQTKEIKDLTPFPGIKAGIITARKEKLYLSLNKDNPKFHDLYVLDINTGTLTLVEKNPGDVTIWILDPACNLRAKETATPEGGAELWVRDTATAPWKKAITWDLEQAGSSSIIGFNPDGTALYITDARDTNTNQLIEYNYKTGQTKLIYQDPCYDSAGGWYNQETGILHSVRINRAKAESIPLDRETQELFDNMARTIRGELQIVSCSDDEQTCIVAAKNDTDPLSYYLVTKKPYTCKFLWTTRPALKNYQLAPMETFTLTARDGLKLEGYVTYPVGLKRKDLPMVLNVHGGPWTRDSWGYNPEAQWLGNRGYMCVQVNFRGSTGYGKEFLNAGNREWGNKMHHDLIDTVNYFIKNGQADPKRIAIYGASYGGYAALCGAAFTPDVFCCAVDIVGPSNLITLLNSIPPYWTLALLRAYKQIGNPETEADFLKSCSPLFSAPKITKPLLIAQGANDPRVKQAEAEQIVEALKRHNVPHEYMLFPDEGHGFTKPAKIIKPKSLSNFFLLAKLVSMVC
jgi:dipeptidyl aminopeptidase/acylaminoacyl peptidase